MKKLIVLLIIIMLISTADATRTPGAKSAATTAPGAVPTAPTTGAPGPYYYIATTAADGIDEGQTFSSDTLETGNVRQISSSTYNTLNDPQIKYTYTPATSPATPATIKARVEHPEDSGALADYQTTDTTTITLNPDGTTTSTLDRQTLVRSGVVRGDWNKGRREGQTTHYNRDGTVNNVQTPVYPVTTDLLGQRTYAQTPAYYSRQDFSGPPEQKQLDSITLTTPGGVPYYRVDNEGNKYGPKDLAVAQRAYAKMYASEADMAEKNYLALQIKVTELQAKKETTQEQMDEAEAEAAAARTEAEAARTEAEAEDKKASQIEGLNEKDLTPEAERGKGEANQEMADNALSWTASQKLRGFWGRFGLFMKAYDEFSGLRQYSAIGLGWYDEGVQKRRALYQQEFCLNAGIENCVTSQICGRVYPVSADNVLAGAGPTGQYVTSGIINAERSIPIELEGMTRQQMIDLFGNTTVIQGRRINLTDPAFNPQILGRIKIWQYHVQYTLSNNAEPKRTMQHNVQFKRAQPGSTTSYGTPVKEAKWYPIDQTLEPGVTATDQNLIWKYSATEYTDVCLTFEPSLPSKTKLVNHICTPFIEYAGGPTEVGAEIGAAPEAGAPAEQPGTFI